MCRAFVTCFLKIKNTGVWKPVMQELLSSDNLYSFRHKAFAVASETGLKVHRIGQYKELKDETCTLFREACISSLCTHGSCSKTKLLFFGN